MYTPWLLPPALPPNPPVANTIGSRLAADPPSAPRIALLGLDAQTADGVREHLYRLFWDFEDLAVVDLGNLRKRTVDFAIPLLKELHSANILPVTLGAPSSFLPAQYLAFGELNRQVGVCILDSRIRLRTESTGTADAENNLDAAVYRQRPPMYHLAHLGSQRQLVDPALDALFMRRHFERYTLGQSRADLGELEPTVRDADVLAIDLAGLAAAEVPAQEGFGPSGFSVQEACQLAFYAGSSDRLSSFGLFGYRGGDASDRERETSLAAQAQLIWYFMHGVSRRKGDFPVSTSGLHEYVVDSKVADRLTFWRSERSNRWWVQVPVSVPDGEERNRLVACSYKDYLQISQSGDLPSRLQLAFSRY
ncbi:hypothetical protein CGL56_01180 [Neolewinella marina]|uniref:Arginase n=2 Tax=Neolewinella marina TaxID=438751 RepID=A0A2G0CI92_9BACT|nr:hypothetical protein CGL56_01180 [Neolewinella marina]